MMSVPDTDAQLGVHGFRHGWWGGSGRLQVDLQELDNVHKLRARISAWMRMKGISLPMLSKSGLEPLHVKKLLRSDMSTLREQASMLLWILNAIDMDRAYFLAGQMPTILNAPDKMILGAYEVYFEFYSLVEETGRYGRKLLRVFVNERLRLLDEVTSQTPMAVYEKRPPQSVEEIQAEFLLWKDSKNRGDAQ